MDTADKRTGGRSTSRKKIKLMSLLAGLLKVTFRVVVAGSSTSLANKILHIEHTLALHRIRTRDQFQSVLFLIGTIENML